MTDSIYLGDMPEGENTIKTKIDRSVKEPFIIQADDEYGMFRFIARSVSDKEETE